MHGYIIGTGYAYQKKYGYRTQPGRIPSEGAVQVGQSIKLPTTETASPPSVGCFLKLTLRSISETLKV